MVEGWPLYVEVAEDVEDLRPGVAEGVVAADQVLAGEAVLRRRSERAGEVRGRDERVGGVLREIDVLAAGEDLRHLLDLERGLGHEQRGLHDKPGDAAGRDGGDAGRSVVPCEVDAGAGTEPGCGEVLVSFHRRRLVGDPEFGEHLEHGTESVFDIFCDQCRDGGSLWRASAGATPNSEG